MTAHYICTAPDVVPANKPTGFDHQDQIPGGIDRGRRPGPALLLTPFKHPNF